MNVVANNIPGMFTSRQIGITNKSKAKSTEKLSSGYKINRAADDAAGLTISENMRRMIRGLTQASLNVEDGVSLCQVADGYLNEVHDMLHRLTELSVKGSNATLTDDDRQAIDEEVGQLKKEMKRIFNVANFNEIPLFHVPYTPEVSPPDDMKVFHVGNGQVGGLEFNNVRYNISELKALGIPIDDNGIATDDLEFGDKIFTLWDGEEVDLSIKKGQSIGEAVRNYKWEATDDGIYINKKLTAEWGEVRYGSEDWDDRKKLSETDMLSSGKFASGLYSFKHHGMTIEFELDEEADMEDLKNGINGDEATKPASWDVSAGGVSKKEAANVISTSNKILITNANKNVIDQDYYIVANAEGIAVKRVNPKNASDTSTTSIVKWNTFVNTNSSAVLNKDENGNDVETNGGYPISNWGTENDSNGAPSITFDANATYRFESPDSDMPFKFNFKLAESASLEEVINNLNNVKIRTDYNIQSEGGLTIDWTGKSGGVMQSRKIMATFEIQRAYGRDFDDKNREMTGNLTVKRDLKSATPGVNEPTTHRLSSPNYSGEKKIGGPVDDPNETVTYFAVEAGTDTDGNPLYEYYKYTEHERSETWQKSYTRTDTWSENVTYTFEGKLNSVNMDPVVKDQTEYYTRDIIQTMNEQRLYTVGNCTKITDLDDVPDDIKSNPAAHVEEARAVGETVTYKSTTASGVYEIPEGGIGSAYLTGVSESTIRGVNFRSASTYNEDVFSFDYNVSRDLAEQLAGSSSPVQAATLKFSGRGYDYPNRVFYPSDRGIEIDEATLKSKLNVPKKNLIIQAGAEGDHTITMEWSPLNLTILGIYSANTRTQEDSLAAIGMVKDALDVISETRSIFGAYQNRFEHTIMNLDNVVENTQAAESRIRDTDMAKEMVKYAKDNILEQAGTAMLVQSNQSKNWIINLLNS